MFSYLILLIEFLSFWFYTWFVLGFCFCVCWSYCINGNLCRCWSWWAEKDWLLLCYCCLKEVAVPPWPVVSDEEDLLVFLTARRRWRLLHDCWHWPRSSCQGYPRSVLFVLPGASNRYVKWDHGQRFHLKKEEESE